MKADHMSGETVEQATSLRIIEINPQTDSRWETLMKRLPTSVIYQHPSWLGVVEDVYGYQPMHLACEDSTGALRGLLPLFFRRGLRTGRLCFSPPAISGPLTDDEHVGALLIQEALRRSREVRATQFQFMTRSTRFDHLVNDVVGVSVHETYELQLPAHPSLLRLDSRIRRAVKKATRLGVQVRQAETTHDLRIWYTLYLQTMRRLMVIPQPYRVFEQAWYRLHSQGLLRLLLAEHTEAGQRRLVAGFLYFQWGGTISHLYTGWRREDQDLRPNDLLHWQAIQDACTEGLHCYDFGHAPVGNQGIAQFKAKWVAQTRTTYRYSYPTVSHGGTTGPQRMTEEDAQSTSALSQSNEAKSLKQRIVKPLWQRLPLKATELVAEWSRALHYY